MAKQFTAKNKLRVERFGRKAESVESGLGKTKSHNSRRTGKFDTETNTNKLDMAKHWKNG